MNKLVTYLNFNGNCREAMTFYQKCLGGYLEFQTIGEFPESENLPPKMKSKILHSSLRNETFTIMASDIVSDDEFIKGNSISILIECNTKNEMQKYLKRLSRGGRMTSPIKKTYWGSFFGGLIDKFNNNWLLYSLR